MKFLLFSVFSRLYSQQLNHNNTIRHHCHCITTTVLQFVQIKLFQDVAVERHCGNQHNLTQFSSSFRRFDQLEQCVCENNDFVSNVLQVFCKRFPNCSLFFFFFFFFLEIWIQKKKQQLVFTTCGMCFLLLFRRASVLICSFNSYRSRIELIIVGMSQKWSVFVFSKP